MQTWYNSISLLFYCLENAIEKEKRRENVDGKRKMMILMMTLKVETQFEYWFQVDGTNICISSRFICCHGWWFTQPPILFSFVCLLLLLLLCWLFCNCNRLYPIQILSLFRMRACALSLCTYWLKTLIYKIVLCFRYVLSPHAWELGEYQGLFRRKNLLELFQRQSFLSSASSNFFCSNGPRANSFWER